MSISSKSTQIPPLTQPNILLRRFYTGDNVWSATVALYKCRIKADLRDRAEKSGGRGRNGNREEAQCCQIVRLVILQGLT